MSRILILTYYWPPAGGPGVQRWVKMGNELVARGHELHVITVADGSYPSRDESLVSEIDSRIHVIKTKTREPFALFNRLRGKRGKEASVGMIGLSDKASIIQRIAVYIRSNFFVPDGRMGWRPFAYRAAKNLLNELELDVVISTGPPHSVHAVARKLQRKHNLKWIADLRDPWVNIHYHDEMPLSNRAIAKHQTLEDQTLKNANAVTVVSPGMKREFEDRVQRIEVIYNGYDAKDFPDQIQIEPSSKFTIRYTGNMKPNQDVPDFWGAIKELCDAEPGFKEDVRIELIGKKDPRIFAQNQALLPQGMLISQDVVPHAEAVAAMRSANLLLFIIPQARNNALILTGKLFEYLAALSPMLSLGPSEGDAARIISKSGRNPMLDYADRTGMKDVMSNHYRLWKSTGSSHSPGEFSTEHKAFSRREQSERYSQLIEKVLS